MHTIVILSDTLEEDDKIVENLKSLFPECRIQIVNKASKESGNSNLCSKANSLKKFDLNNWKS